MQTKKICIITTVTLTMESFVIAAAYRLKENNYDITLVCSMDENFITKYKNDFKCINIQMERGADPIGMISSIAKFLFFFKKNKFDIIQYSTPNASFYASIAAYLTRSKNRVYCQWGIRYVGFEGFKRKLFKAIEKITCALSTHIRPVSQKNLKFAINEGHYKLNKAKVLGVGGTIGVDETIFDINKKEEFKLCVLEKFPTLKEYQVFGFVGRVVRDKGLNELIEAWKKFSINNANVKLLIIGSYDQNHDPIDNELLNWALSEESILFTGHISDVHKYMSVLDVLVHPTYREGFSMVIQQAHMLGVPAITTDVPGPSEVIDSGCTGLLVEVKSSESLLIALDKFKSDEGLLKSMSKNSYNRAKKFFRREVMLNLILEDKNEIINTIK
jgi:glycosyltransferase involved in cell wall biosynthesis